MNIENNYLDEEFDRSAVFLSVIPPRSSDLDDKAEEIFEMAGYLEDRALNIKSMPLTDEEYALFTKTKSDLYHLIKDCEKEKNAQWARNLKKMLMNTEKALLGHLRYHSTEHIE